MNFVSYLWQPFPKAENKWKIIISISLFVSIFLIVFQPFGISLITGNNKFLFLSGYGVITFITLIIDLILIEKLFPKFFNEEKWTIWKEFIWLFWVIFSIGLGNAFYTVIFFENSKPTFEIIISFQIVTIIVSLIPITILIISKQKYLLSKHLNSANDLNKLLDKGKDKTNKNQAIKFFADNEKDFIEFDLTNFLYIESSGNYVELYISENNKIVRKTFRSTLKRSLDFFADTPDIIQCHRAFIINTSKIKSANGNSQGLRLSIKNCTTEVPVSRGFVNDIKNKLSK